ncbi:hypothetical protein HDU76_000426 [Blyttiomyces sp. JEL0837]|nr:hypothetical protein HDU76_000426 [Blyttiomyces sp. JEL0837]
MRLEQLKSHLEKDCVWNLTSCINKDVGCQHTCPEATMDQHLTICAFGQLKDYILSTGESMAAMKALIEATKEIRELRRQITMNQITGRDSIVVEEAIEPEVENKTWPGGAIECRRTISEHRTGVTSLAVFEGSLYSGAYDGSIKAWSTEQNNVECLATLADHRRKIYSLVVHGDRLYSGSSDGKIKVWNLDDLTCIATLEGHTEGINALTVLNSTTMVSASSDKTIKIWDLPTSTVTHSIEESTSEVLDITVSSGMNMLFSSSYDANIIAYDLNSYSRIRTLSGHNWEVWQVEFTDGYLFSGSHDHTIKRWDPRMFVESCTLKGHKGYVHALVAGNSCLISGCADKSIKIWK